MQKIRAVIVDDEEFAIIDIKEELSSYPNIELVGTYSNGLEGLNGIHKLQPDLVFVDVEMPELNGFEMLGRLNYSPIIIFCTGYSKYAIDGYAYDPTDFLLKPIKKQRFQTAMERAFSDIERKNLEDRLLQQKQRFGYILLEYRDLHGESRKVCVWPEDILYVKPQEDNGNYIEYHLADQSCHVLKRTLKKALEELGESGFFQVHKSYLVNSSKIQEFYKNEFLILQSPNSKQIPVSRAYRKMVKEFLKNHTI
ncbi:MAG: two-component system LytT family response regulator [bacterium]|jgi:two-component system LytT family response regulator